MRSSFESAFVKAASTAAGTVLQPSAGAERPPLEYDELTLTPDGTRFVAEHRRVSDVDVEFNFADLRVGLDPYPVYARLRREHPVLRRRHGLWVLSRYEDCVTVLKNSHQWSADSRNARSERFLEQSQAFGSDQAVYPYLFWSPPRGPVRPFMFLDEPDHKRLRSLVAQAFTRSTLSSYEPRIVQLVEDMLARALAADDINFVRDFSYPLPVTVICELLGIPAEDHVLFGEWSRPLANMLSPDFMLTARQREASRVAVLAMVQYLLGLIQSRRGGGDDLLSSLVAAEEAGDRLSEWEVIATVLILLMAGHETTVNLISNALLAFLRHPEQAESLASNPEIARQAVDETLRFDAPVQNVARTVLSDVEIDGHHFAAGEHAVLLVGAANRDPAVFEQPDRYDVTRENASRHIGFGSGIHACIGSPLARMEGQAALRAIAAVAGDLELTRPPVYRGDVVLRGPDVIMLRRRRPRPRSAVAHSPGGNP